VREGLLYAGTEYGMFVSFDDGTTWKKFQQNLPVTPITDITLFRGDLVLSTMGRGFWILDKVTTLQDENITQLGDSPVLFQPDDTYRYQTPWGGDFPNYPSTSVIIDYYLPSDVKDGVSLQILDAQGKEVSTIVSDSTQLKSTSEKVEDMSLSMTFVYMDEKLEAKKGINRFEWNLEQKGAWAKNKRRRYRNGPMALPGKYTAKLTVGNQSFEKQFEILMDPKLEGDGITMADLQAQQALQLKVIDLLSEARMLQDKVEEKIKELEKANAGESQLQPYKDILKELKNDDGAYPEVVMVAQISYLYYILSSGDKVPGQEEKDRYQELLTQFNALKQKANL
jgi:putative component of toxin-antitoxin plasmid stabilization module